MDQLFTTRPGPALDLSGPGRHHPRLADDVRHIALSRLLGEALRLDPDDVVQQVYSKLLRVNRPRPVPSSRGTAWCYGASAYDPSRASLSKYVVQVTSGIIADMLATEQHREAHELHGDPSREDLEMAAPESDADDTALSLDAAPCSGPERERFFLALCCLHELGELPVAEQLWRRALRLRAAERQGSLFGASELAALESAPPAHERQQRTPREPVAQLALF